MKWLIVAWYLMGNGLPNIIPVKFVTDRDTCVSEAARMNSVQDSAHIFCTYFTPD